MAVWPGPQRAVHVGATICRVWGQTRLCSDASRALAAHGACPAVIQRQGPRPHLAPRFRTESRQTPVQRRGPQAAGINLNTPARWEQNPVRVQSDFILDVVSHRGRAPAPPQVRPGLTGTTLALPLVGSPGTWDKGFSHQRSPQRRYPCEPHPHPSSHHTPLLPQPQNQGICRAGYGKSRACPRPLQLPELPAILGVPGV